jgi:hypothetical protein
VAVYAVILASGSAAIVLPTRGRRPEALVIAQVTVADVAAILAVPLVLQPGRAAHLAEGGVPIAAAGRSACKEHVITAALGAAVTLAAPATLGLCAIGTGRLARRAQVTESA